MTRDSSAEKPTVNHLGVPMDLVLADLMPLRWRMVLLLASMRTTSEFVELPYRTIAEVLGVSTDEVRKRASELLTDRPCLIERRNGALRLRWESLPTAEQCPGFEALRTLNYAHRRAHSKLLRSYLSDNRDRAMSALAYRLTDAEWEWLQSANAFRELSFWSYQLPRAMADMEAKMPKHGAVCIVIQIAYAYSREYPVRDALKLVQSIAKDRGSEKYARWARVGLDRSRDACPTLAQRLFGVGAADPGPIQLDEHVDGSGHPDELERPRSPNPDSARRRDREARKRPASASRRTAPDVIVHGPSTIPTAAAPAPELSAVVPGRARQPETDQIDTDLLALLDAHLAEQPQYVPPACVRRSTRWDGTMGITYDGRDAPVPMDPEPEADEQVMARAELDADEYAEQ